ncbi:S-layer homology domain-containing protein [Neobacillus sp. NPDC058068]
MTDTGGKDAVEKLASAGVITGYDDGNYT